MAIAAGLMELPLDDVRAALRKSPPPRKPAATVAFTNRGGLHRSVVVERKPSRRARQPSARQAARSPEPCGRARRCSVVGRADPGRARKAGADAVVLLVRGIDAPPA